MKSRLLNCRLRMRISVLSVALSALSLGEVGAEMISNSNEIKASDLARSSTLSCAPAASPCPAPCPAAHGHATDYKQTDTPATNTSDDGSFLADKDCWESWWSILACSLVAVETDSWCASHYRTPTLMLQTLLCSWSTHTTKFILQTPQLKHLTLWWLQPQHTSNNAILDYLMWQ